MPPCPGQFHFSLKKKEKEKEKEKEREKKKLAGKMEATKVMKNGGQKLL
jgi:hypothetical protein